MDLVINDIHFGMSKGNEVMLKSLTRAFEELIFSNNKQYNRIFILGDTVESKISLLNKVSVEMDKVFHKLSKKCNEMYILIGNHDLMFENRYEEHSLERFKLIPNCNILVGGGELDIDGRKVVYHSYNKTENIEKWLNENNIKGDVFLGHIETDGYNIYKYVNDNFKLGLSGHIHNRMEIGNFVYLPSFQEHTFAEMDSQKGFIEIDWNTLKYNVIENNISGKYKKVYYGQEITREMIENNYLEINIDMAIVNSQVVNKNSVSLLMGEFFNKINSFNPALIVRKVTVDSSDETKDSYEHINIDDNLENYNISEEIIEKIEDLNIGEYQEETVETIKQHLKIIGKL